MEMQYPDFPGTTFKGIQGFLGYCVGDSGCVWSLWVRKGLGRGNGTTAVLGKTWKRLKNSIADGYHAVNLGRGNKRFIHVLVLEAFVGPCPPGHECRHLDGNPANNHLGNLCWGTSSENHADQYRHGTRVAGNSHPKSKLTSEQVCEVRRIWSEGHLRQREIAERFGVRQSLISRIVNHRHRVTAKEEVR